VIALIWGVVIAAVIFWVVRIVAGMVYYWFFE
jgi:hypothetical protein